MIRISRIGWITIALVLLAPWLVLLWLHHNKSPAPGEKPLAPATKSTATRGELRTGPWGQLHYLRIAIEPPEEFIPDNYTSPANRWTFKETEPAEIEALWERAKLTPEQRELLANPARRKVNGKTTIIEPTREFVLGLSSEARGTIYTMLARFPENGPQQEPFRFRNDVIDDWFAGSGLDDDIIALTKRLIYQRNGTSFLSDYDLILDGIKDRRVRTLYLKTLARKSALLVTLRVDRNTDIEAVAQYWGRGRRAKDVRPLLQSLARQPGPSEIDILHLVPQFARSLAYTYPLPSEDAKDANRDCHWTAFNFFKEFADDRFTDIDFVRHTLKTEYYPVAGEPQLGDILMFVQPGGVVLHSCVYIADDIVFTKNGPSFAVPWQFARLESVLAFYSVGEQPLDVRRYRSKAY